MTTNQGDKKVKSRMESRAIRNVKQCDYKALGHAREMMAGNSSTKKCAPPTTSEHEGGAEAFESRMKSKQYNSFLNCWLC
jgi:hypothetical protein